MLRFNFSRVFKARGIEKPFSYLLKSGYSDNFATRVINNRIAKLNLNDIEKLCELLKCTPNDFLEWIPDSKDFDTLTHPLVSIKRGNEAVHLAQLLNTVPLHKLADIEALIKNELGK